MNLLSKRNLIIGAGAGLVSIVSLLFFFFRQLIWYFVIAAVAIGVIWLVGHFALRLFRRKKQQQFDAGVAAREGIDDRKREWENWTDELERQGIDRYDLPFYLLVGEPQSGKSVLLQNSDLHFPFGQTRLSGIGGTRGCDWWFTEEAVILDLAGRLFTHEGGASDEAEWEAFLGLLTTYRPTCPANGVMLVIPSDSLATDSRDEASRKASQIQSALLTLTNKLQAQVPIFLILTKADRIFGFAETVHRLTVEQRQQMFGWSRPSEDFDAPFDIVEVRQAFQDLVGRARLLRETMLSTVRLPEGLSEVDRMFAFPDELNALGPNLEIYLKRVFSESAIVDRLFFRGFYLTSGLQTGAPIAKVCSELMGGVGEADKRDLEALFSKQQAYFIRDLIRRRVFSERGLVRPTQTRIVRNQRRAWIGYGLAATIAVVSVVASLYYVLSEYDPSELDTFEQAIESSASVANDTTPDLGVQLDALDATWAAMNVRNRSLEAGMMSRHASFVELYATLFDQRSVPELRHMAESAAGAALNAGPPDIDTLRSQAHAIRLLASGFDPANVTETEAVLSLLPKADADQITEALDRRRELDPPQPRSLPGRSADGRFNAPLQQAVLRVESLWDHTLTGGDPLQIGGAAGYLVAWKAVDESHRQLEKLDLERFPVDGHDAFLRSAASYYQASNYLTNPSNTRELVPAPDGDWELSKKTANQALETLEAERKDFLQVTYGEAGSDLEIGPWPALSELNRFESDVAFRGRSAGVSDDVSAGIVRGIEGRKTRVPTKLLASQLQAGLREACNPARLVPGANDSRPDRLPESIHSALRHISSNPEELSSKVLLAKLRVLQAHYLEDYPDWRTLGESLVAGAPKGTSTNVSSRLFAAVLEHLFDLREIVDDTAPPDQPELSQPWAEAIERMLANALQETRKEVTAWAANPQLDTDLLHALGRASSAEGRLSEPAGAMGSDYLEKYDLQLSTRWSKEPEDSQKTIQIVSELADHLSSIRGALGEPSPRTLDRWLSGPVTELLQARMDKHSKTLENASLGTQETSLASAADDVTKKLMDTALDGWRKKLDDYNVFDPKDLEPALGELARWSAFAEADAQLIELVNACRRISDPKNNDYYSFLQSYAEQLNRKDLEENGPRLAEIVAAKRADEPQGPPKNSAEYYLAGLYMELDTLAVQALRASYVADLSSELKKLDDLKRCLVASDLSDANDHRSEIIEQLAQLFDPNKVYDKLQKRYLQDGEQPLDFRPMSEDASQPDWWAFDQFLRELRGFIFGVPAEAEIAKCAVGISMEPSEKRNDVWAKTWFFTNVDKDDSALSTPLVERLGPLQWEFGDTQQALSMRWSRAAGEPQHDDAKILGNFPLAPMVLCWSSPINLTLEAPTESWDVEAAAGGGQTARFKLEFDRPLPPRPKSPW